MWILVFLGAVVLFAAEPASATQHLVRPGMPWSDLAPRLQPGDEIILMPGRHLSASFDDLQGTAERPITIRGLHPDHPAIIEARREGIRLRRPQHVVVRDLTITGATVAGISITDERSASQPGHPLEGRPDRATTETDRSEPWPAHLTIRNVTIERTGPRGRRHGISLTGVEHVRVERSTIEGWGGSAIKVVASADVVIDRCTMRGRPDHEQLSGIQIRAGSENVRITRSTISDAGESGIVVGGTSRAEEFRPPLASNSAAGPIYEARRISIERCVIKGGETAFAFIGADRCVVRNNAILNPSRWVYFIGVRSTEPSEAGSAVHQSTFGANIVLWKPGSLQSLTYVQPPADAKGMELEQNLWWSSEDMESRAALGQPAGTARSQQVTDVDPNLGENLRPRNRRAQVFGPDGP